MRSSTSRFPRLVVGLFGMGVLLAGSMLHAAPLQTHLSPPAKAQPTQPTKELPRQTKTLPRAPSTAAPGGSSSADSGSGLPSPDRAGSYAAAGYLVGMSVDRKGKILRVSLESQDRAVAYDACGLPIANAPHLAAAYTKARAGVSLQIDNQCIQTIRVY